MWLLAAATTLITLVVGVIGYFLALLLPLYDMTGAMPPKVRDELEQLVASGQRGSDRYFELYDRYASEQMLLGDWLVLGAIALVSVALAGSIAFFFARRISRPITAVAEAAARVAAGDPSVRVPVGHIAGEEAELVDSFNAMAAAIQTYERERTVFTAGIAHELRTPLTILKGRLHGLIDGVIAADDGEAQRLLRQVDHLLHIVGDLRTLAHADAGELALDRRRIDAAAVVHAAIGDLAAAALAAQVRFAERLSPSPLLADPQRLTQIVTNLLTNAIKHAPAGTAIEVTVAPVGAQVSIGVADSGPGFADADAERLFMPFWRGGAERRDGRPGSGMGLALAATLVEAHGGRIAAANRSPGARFTVELPRG